MPKKASPKLNAPPPSSVAVSDCKRLAAQCKRSIEKSLNTKGLGFVERRAADNRTVCLLTGENATRAEAKYVYPVVPFLQAGQRFYWLAASLEFVFQSGFYYLLNANLLVFEGRAMDEKKMPLLRADWGCVQTGDRANHAQPHWHTYASQDWTSLKESAVTFREEQAAGAFFSIHERELEREPSSSSSEIEKFHFAMASTWHLDGKGSHQVTMLDKGLVKWMEGCLGYTLEQLAYMSS